MKKVRPLFSYMNVSEPVKEPEVKEDTSIVKKSVIGGWTSIYQPDAPTERFMLINPSGETFSCKFYNRITNDFVGSSLLSMYNLRDHFDRSLIPEDEGL